MTATTASGAPVILAARSAFSLLAGTAAPEALVDAALRLGYGAVALADRNQLAAAPRFLLAAAERGLPAVLGVELTDATHRAIVLARDAEGYASLCRLVSARQLALGRQLAPHLVEAFSERPVAAHRLGEGEGFSLVAALPQAAAGVFVLVDDPDLAAVLAPVLPAGVLSLVLVRPARSPGRERALCEAAARLGLPLAATPAADFLVPDDHRLHRLLAAVRRNRTYAEIAADDPELFAADAWLRPAADHIQAFADQAEALAHARALAAACALSVPPRGRILPTLAPAQAGAAQAGADAERLTALCREGVRWRFGFVESAEVARRLAAELDLIIRLGFAGYFLVVHEIVLHARRLGTPVAGRGSGGSSLVAYVLGITNVDPLAFGIAFERFLNAGRLDAPDLDIDFSWRDRDRIIAHVYERFGAERVAMVSTHVTFQARGAFREAARAAGMPDAMTSAFLAEEAPRGETFDAVAAAAARTARIPAAAQAAIRRAAARLVGIPRHLGVHPGGIVLTPGAIAAHAPLELAAKGVVVTHFDKDGVEEMGLVKLDLLGNRALATAREAIEIVARDGRTRIDAEHLADGDPATIALLERGDTLGCNQLESPAMRRLLMQVRPRSLGGLMQTLALIRPGAASIGNKEEFVRRARGLAAPLVADARLASLLEESHGILLYEDDAMLVARAIADLDGVAADRLRKGITKARDDATRWELSQRFLAACDATGTPRATAEHLWVQMAKFNAYSFCKAHAASYARIAYAVAYLKAHHPAALWVAALNNNQGLYEKRVYVEAARRQGVRILAPSIHASLREATREGDGIRIGLDQIRGLSVRTVDELIALRPFRSLDDLLTRVAISQPEAENLVACGAADEFGRTRAELMLALHTTLSSARRLRKGALLPAATTGGWELPARPQWDLGARRAMEEAILGLSLDAHPLVEARAHATAGPGRLVTSRQLRAHVGLPVRILGILDTCRRVETEAGEDMEFLTFEDEHDLFEVALFPAAYAAFARAVRGIGPYLISGRVQDDHGAIALIADQLRLLPGARDAAAGRRLDSA